MVQVKQFVFNEIQVNTYLVYDETKECVIVDAGNNSHAEHQQLSKYISDKGLTPVALLNTHGHFDHIMGNAYIEQAYGLLPRMSKADLPLVEQSVTYVQSFGLQMEQPPMPKTFLNDGAEVRFGSSLLQVIATPGHSPGGLCFYCKEVKLLFSGDTLFKGSIGRTDLPGGDYDELIASIHTKLLVLDSDTQVFCGHGPVTSIGFEAANNPFINSDI